MFSGGLQAQIFEMVLVLIVLGAILIGSNRGLMFGLYSMVKNLLVIAASVAIAIVLPKYLPENWPVKQGIALCIGFFISLVVFNIIGRLIRLVDDIEGLSTMNRLGGALMGAILGMFFVWSLLAILGAMQELEWCRNLVEAGRKNDVVMWFQKNSPLPYILDYLGFPTM